MISIVICSITPAKVEAVRANLGGLLGDEAHEFVVITDAKGMCEGYNRGLARARGEIVIFCHDDIEIVSADFRDRLLHYMTTYDVIGVAGTDKVECGIWTQAGIPHVFGQVAHLPKDGEGYEVEQYGVPARAIDRIQAIDGVFVAARRDVAMAVGFDEQTFQQFHLYDIDFSFRAFLKGFRLAVCNDINLVHLSRGMIDQKYKDDLNRFDLKFGQQLRPREPWAYVPAVIKVPAKRDLLETMRWRSWADAESVARFNPMSYPILFQPPWFLSGRSDWVEHIPLAHLLVQLTRPSMLVEVGTNLGDSYMALCWACQQLNTGSRCFGLNDGRAPELFDNLRGFHDRAFGGFSKLDRSDAAKFADGSIDLLHLDTQSADDLRIWLPKLGPRGVLLFHEPASVASLWFELARKYPSFELLHGRGVGIVAVGADAPAEGLRFIRDANLEPAVMRNFFANLGQRAVAMGKLATVMSGLLELRMLSARCAKSPVPVAVEPFAALAQHEQIVHEIAQTIIALANSRAG